jgi:hypothetical protein
MSEAIPGGTFAIDEACVMTAMLDEPARPEAGIVPWRQWR